MWIDGESFWETSPETHDRIEHRFGVLFQSDALWSSMMLAENVALPLEQYTGLSAAQVRKQVGLKLALVGLAGFEDYYPSLADQRGHAKTRRLGLRHGIGPRYPVFR